MDTVPNPARYPIPRDDRLTDDFVGLVGDLLQHHGFPPVFSDPDLDRLCDALGGFLYGPAAPHSSPPANVEHDDGGTTTPGLACGYVGRRRSARP